MKYLQNVLSNTEKTLLEEIKQLLTFKNVQREYCIKKKKKKLQITCKRE